MTDRTPDGASERPPARRHRRVQRAGAPGADPTPQGRPETAGARVGERAGERAGEDSDHSPSFGSNDEQLRRDVPPHY